jgi:hypothetical protein
LRDEKTRVGSLAWSQRGRCRVWPNQGQWKWRVEEQFLHWITDQLLDQTDVERQRKEGD